MGAISWKTEVGVNHVGAYQVSGRPYAKGAIDCSTTTKIEFPKVTRWVQVINRDNSSTDCRVGFSQEGLENGGFYFVLGQPPANGTNASAHMELKISEIYVFGSDTIDIVAGLTNISPTTLNTDSGTNWSGSAGVG